jgi:glutamyl/glutaminyl-tRNA synthetase
VDDKNEVTLVVRASTPRVDRPADPAARLLGRAEPPAFLHHSLIMKSPDQKLSKSDGDTGIRELRAKGWSPQQVIDAALSALT